MIKQQYTTVRNYTILSPLVNNNLTVAQQGSD